MSPDGQMFVQGARRKRASRTSRVEVRGGKRKTALRQQAMFGKNLTYVSNTCCLQAFAEPGSSVPAYCQARALIHGGCGAVGAAP